MLFRLVAFFLLSTLPFILAANSGQARIIYTTDNVPGTLVESCEQESATVSVVLVTPSTDTLWFRIIDMSTAVLDTDFVSMVPDTLMILPGQERVDFAISAINDGLQEFPDLIRYDLFSIGTPEVLCNFVEIILRDGLDVNLVVLEDQSNFCVPPTVTLTASGAPGFLWTPSDLFDDPTLDTVILTEPFTGNIQVNGIGPGCASSDQDQLTFTDPTFTIQRPTSDTICQGETTSYVIVPNAVTLDDIIVTPSTWIVSINNNTVDLLPDSSGWVTFEGIQDTCSFVDSVFITVDQIVLPVLIKDTTICVGETLQLATIAFNTLLTTYEWSPIDRLNNPFLPNPVAFPSITTNYTVMSTSALKFCKFVDSTLVSVINTAIDYITLDISNICLGDTVRALLTLQDAAEISTFPEMGSAIIGDTLLFFPTDDESFIVSVDFQYCRDTLFQDIAVTDGTVRTEVLTDSVICLGDSVIIKVATNDPPISLTWTPDDDLVSQDDSLFVFIPDSSLILDLVVDFGLCSYQENFDITSRDNRFEIDIDASIELCKGDTIVGLLTLNEPPDSFSFSPTMDFTNRGDTLFFFPSQSTQYSFVADYGACTVTRDFDMNVDSLPDLSLATAPDKSNFCQGESILVASPAFENPLYPDITFAWNPDDANLISDPSLSSAEFEVQTSGTFIRETTNNVCSRNDTFDLILVDGAIDVSFTDTSICMGTTIPFVIADTDLTDILWTPSFNLSCNDCAEPVMSPSTTTVYNVDYQRDGCPFDEQITLRIVTIDTTLFNPVSGCMDSLVQIQIDEPQFSNGVWDASDNLSCLDCLNPTFVINDSETFVLRDLSDQCERIGLLEVEAFPSIEVDISLSSNAQIFLGQQVTVNVAVQNTSNPDIRWLVNNVLQSETSSTLTFTADELSYTVQALVSDITTQCSAQDMLSFTVDVVDEIAFPNVFTPNGDNTNDLFKPSRAEALTINSMKIYNRWGQLIYQSTDASATWDGRTMGGDEVNSDTYIYVVNLSKADGTEEIFNGEISLIR